MSWLQVSPESHFSLANIPFGIVERADGVRVGASRIGDNVVDLSKIEKAGLLADALGSDSDVFSQPTLNAFATLFPSVRSNTRSAIQKLLTSSDSNKFQQDSAAQKSVVLPLNSVKPCLPFQIPDFVDYSVFPAHGTNAGRAIFGPDTKLPASFNALPMVYNGRAGTVSVSEEITRPRGQTRAFSAQREVEIGECKALDWEFEINIDHVQVLTQLQTLVWNSQGAFVANPTEEGTALSPSSAQDHIFGYVLLNDWSARDIQAFEMVPLGPFNGKSFATTISPWVVTPDALKPFAAELPPRLEGTQFEQPEYLSEAPGAKSNFRIDCETFLRVGEDPSTAHPVSRAQFDQMFWSFPQLIAYQTYAGARISTGDLLGSGTISNEGDAAQGCMLELSQAGKRPLQVGTYERRWIHDGDEVIFTASAGVDGAKVGFGDLKGKVNPSKTLKMI
ncbi:BQ5605_C001g00527 [Microbotryum silenes-dioicae]|uniref:Fumarylacetoacetase n=1 Tax=Microbotryum silenes-dioicae TaxID=796604 RepID=A0A2X0M7Q9_9BASI|nr:BQ5605_C001g00527 [Microbotryum silenes-dioicae]